MICLDELTEIYSTSIESAENQAWIAISDSKSGIITAKVQGGSGGDFGNGWKVHISIEPSKIEQAAILIAKILNEETSPRVSIKFSGKSLASSGQPSKQVALCFYEEVLSDKDKITLLFNKIDDSLNKNNIGFDPRPINSLESYTGTKWDSNILLESGNPSRFNYRNEDCTVPEDWLFTESASELKGGILGRYIVVKDNYILQDKGAQVKQSFFEYQKTKGFGHNPVQYSDLTSEEQNHPNAKYFKDPFEISKFQYNL